MSMMESAHPDQPTTSASPPPQGSMPRSPVWPTMLQLPGSTAPDNVIEAAKAGSFMDKTYFQLLHRTTPDLRRHLPDSADTEAAGPGSPYGEIRLVHAFI